MHRIEVNVRNEIYGPEEGTSMHWHGINQIGTPWYVLLPLEFIIATGVFQVKQQAERIPYL